MKLENIITRKYFVDGNKVYFRKKRVFFKNMTDWNIVGEAYISSIDDKIIKVFITDQAKTKNF